jgi:phospholipid/cholesterol/gamma-HCH transport system substrate-binding protein
VFFTHARTQNVKYSNELKVGLTIVVTVIVFALGFRFLSNLPLLQGSYQLHTRLGEANGLVEGNPVRISGVQVGSVKKVALSPGQDAVRVVFRVDGDVKVPEGSRTKITGLSALSGTQLTIEPGPRSNPPVKSGGLIPSKPQTDVLGNLSRRTPDLINHADSLLLNVSAAMRSANETFEGASTLLSDSDSDLSRTLKAVRQSTQALRRVVESQDHRIDQVMKNTEAASSDLRAFTDENADSLDVAVTRLNGAMRSLNDNLASLDTTTARLDTITARIERGDGSLGRLINDSTLYMRIDSTAGHLSFMLEDFQKNPERYLDEMTLVDIF